MAEDPTEQASSDLPEAAGSQFFDQFLRMYIEPEVERRISRGEWRAGAPIVLAQVLFKLGRPAEVRLNAEVRGELQAVASGSFEKGQWVGPEHMTKVTAFLLPEEDADAAHITMVATANGVSLVFSGAYNTLVIQDHLRIADEYIATARAALNDGRLRSFAANAATATELLAKFELLSLPEERVAKSKKHGTVQSFYNQWARLGNTEQRFADLLNRLAGLRDPARYERSDLRLEADEAEKLMEDLDGMREHVEEVRPKRSFEDDAARSHNAIAARDITAGEIIGTGDYIFFN